MLEKFNRLKTVILSHTFLRRKHCCNKWKLHLAEVQLLCVIFILILTFSYAPIGLRDPNTGFIIDTGSAENTKNGVIFVNGDYRPVVAATKCQMICLAISRMSAFSMYPLLIVVFLSKCKATINFLHCTTLAMYLQTDSHDIHAYAGTYIAYDSCIHTLFHLLRWNGQGNLHLLWKCRTGLSGLFAMIFLPFIAFLMMYKPLRDRIRYEIRKSLHYLFYAFAIGICFHVPSSGIPNGGFIAPVMGFVICLYTLDAIYVNAFMSEKIETTNFHVLNSGVLMTMPVSETFQKRVNHGGYAYVCLPWINYEWHAFTLFENPAKQNERQVFMFKAGDWTSLVHEALQRDTRRPVWIKGPFISEYNKAIDYDNQILVATGIGITPALAAIPQLNDSRRVSLVWVVREPEMMEFFLMHLHVVEKGWVLIFYTGKVPLNPILEEMNTNVKIIKGRPNLNDIIPNIIYGIETRNLLPETLVPALKKEFLKNLAEKMDELDRTDLNDHEKLEEVFIIARKHGYQLAALMEQLERTESSTSFLSESESSIQKCEECPYMYSTEAETINTLQEVHKDEKELNIFTERMRYFAVEVGMEEEEKLKQIELLLDDFSQKYHHEYQAHESKFDNCERKQAETINMPSLSAEEKVDNLKVFVKEVECITTGTGLTVEEKIQKVIGILKKFRYMAGSIDGPNDIMEVSRKKVEFKSDEHDGIGDDEKQVSEKTMTAGSESYTLSKIRKLIGFAGSRGSRYNLLRRNSILTSLIHQSTRNTMRPWSDLRDAQEYVKELDGSILSTWGILYCGGNKPVQKNLRGIADEYGIHLGLESFDW